MKLNVLASVLAIGISAALVPAHAQSDGVQKAPTKTMGDEGKLPSTSTMGEHVPNMGTHEETDGPKKKMGDEGKLPATNSMSGKVPEMGQDQ